MENNVIPTTIQEAFGILDNIIPEEDKAAFISQSKPEFVGGQHLFLGAWIRNNWIYGPEDESQDEATLRDKCYRMLAGMKEGEMLFDHPDDVSERFLEKYYDYLKGL